MNTEINQNTIIGHIAGFTDDTKNVLYDILKKLQLFKLVDNIKNLGIFKKFKNINM